MDNTKPQRVTVIRENRDNLSKWSHPDVMVRPVNIVSHVDPRLLNPPS